jgi:hypothetical protein
VCAGSGVAFSKDGAGDRTVWIDCWDMDGRELRDSQTDAEPDFDRYCDSGALYFKLEIKFEFVSVRKKKEFVNEFFFFLNIICYAR